MTTTNVHRRGGTLLVRPEEHDPENPDNIPFGVEPNVWFDQPFWVSYTIERYYAARGREPLTPEQHAENIIGELADVMFGGGSADSRKCWLQARDAIVVAACDFSSRVVAQLYGDKVFVVVCDSPDGKWDLVRYGDRRHHDQIVRLSDGSWVNEYERRYGGRKAA